MAGTKGVGAKVEWGECLGCNIIDGCNLSLSIAILQHRE